MISIKNTMCGLFFGLFSLAVLSSALILCFAGCSDNGAGRDVAAVPEENAGYTPEQGPPDHERGGLELTPVDAQGYQDLIAAHRGKILVVDFWATWCAPCVESFPKLVDLHSRYKERGVVVIGASVDFPGEEDTVVEFLKKQGAGFDNVMVEAEDIDAFISSVSQSWSGDIPAVFVYDRDGEPAGHFFGSGAVASAEAAILELMDGD